MDVVLESPISTVRRLLALDKKHATSIYKCDNIIAPIAL
jgi:hypothetical protein